MDATFGEVISASSVKQNYSFGIHEQLIDPSGVFNNKFIFQTFVFVQQKRSVTKAHVIKNRFAQKWSLKTNFKLSD